MDIVLDSPQKSLTGAAGGHFSTRGNPFRAPFVRAPPAGTPSARALPPKFGYWSLPTPARAACDASRLLGRPLLLAAHPAGPLSASLDTHTTDVSVSEADGCGVVRCEAGQKQLVVVTEAPRLRWLHVTKRREAAVNVRSTTGNAAARCLARA